MTPASTSCSSTTAATAAASASTPHSSQCSRTPTPRSTGFLTATQHIRAKHHPLRSRASGPHSPSGSLRSTTTSPQSSSTHPTATSPTASPRPTFFSRPRAPSLPRRLPTRGATPHTHYTEAPHLVHERATSTRSTRERRRSQTHHRTTLTQRSTHSSQPSRRFLDPTYAHHTLIPPHAPLRREGRRCSGSLGTGGEGVADWGSRSRG